MEHSQTDGGIESFGSWVRHLKKRYKVIVYKIGVLVRRCLQDRIFYFFLKDTLTFYH